MYTFSISLAGGILIERNQDCSVMVEVKRWIGYGRICIFFFFQCVILIHIINKHIQNMIS